MKPAAILHYPRHPPWGSWLPIEAVEAYLDYYREMNGAPDRQKAIERIVTREVAKPVIARLSRTLDYLGWSVLFGIAADAAFMPFDAMHDALPITEKLQKKIIGDARNLAALIDKYSITCVDGKIASRDYGIPFDLPQMLERMAEQLATVKHERIGIGKSAWASPIQAGDGLAQFVRYFDERIGSLVKDGTSTGGLVRLAAAPMARLAMATLNIKDSADDTLGKIEGRVKEFRKTKNTRDNSPHI
ncbi:MAG: hypothetical protein ACYCWC_12570 [Rhodocyclaceae bacterium]